VYQVLIVWYNVQMDKDLKNRTHQELEQLAAELGEKEYVAGYLFSFIHTRDATTIDDITPLSKSFRAKLAAGGYFISRLETAEKFVDPDGTVKFLFAAADGTRFESVLLTDEKGAPRRTLCVSCQAGCRMGCLFCATGRLKFTRDLTAGEIADQVNRAAAEHGKISNVVYMGMGEPFDNYDNVIRSIHILNDRAGKDIGQRHITVSTCGIGEGIERFGGEHLQVRLAVSLHGPTDGLREKIMGIARKYPLEKLLAAIRHYQLATGRRVTFEYCMIRDVNDSTRHAQAMAQLIKDIDAVVNLIEYNPHESCAFEPSPRRAMHRFRDILAEAHIETVIRYRRGRAIKAACGQLGANWQEGCRG